MIRHSLKQYLEKLDQENGFLDDFSVGQEIEKILDAKQIKLTDADETAEFIAFQFHPNYLNTESSWGTYYGPLFVLKNEQGQFVEFPSLQQVDEAVLAYWEKRSAEAKHPILINRYADLVFDLKPKILNTGIDPVIARRVIDSTIEVCKGNFTESLDLKDKLERAFKIALQINDIPRIQILKDVIIETESRYAEDDKPGIWGYAFRWLIVNNDQRFSLTEQERDGLVNDLEERLTRLSQKLEPDPWTVECAVELLATYYAKNKKEDELRLVLEKLEDAFRRNKHANSDGMLVSNYLEKMIGAYGAYPNFKFTKEHKERLVKELSNLSKKSKFNYQEVSVESKISNEVFEQFLVGIFGETNQNPLEIILNKLALLLVLRKGSVEIQLKNLANDHPLLYLVGHTIGSADGFPVAKFGPIDTHYDQHLLQQFSNNLAFQSPFMRISFEKLRQDHAPEIVTEVLMQGALFQEGDRTYISKILKAFWEKDFLVVSALSIPLIEDAVRTLYRLHDLSFIKENKDGGYDVLSLKTLLSGPLIVAVYQNMGADIQYYFTSLLVERIGWNLRDNFAHGISKEMFAQEDIGNRMMHVLLCLALVRKVKN